MIDRAPWPLLNMKAEYTIIRRAEDEPSLARLSTLSAELLLAECESELSKHLRACGLRHVRRLAGGHEMAHFRAEADGVTALVYVLSVCNMAAPAALSPEQMRKCEQEGVGKVLVLPCVVQRMGGVRARCMAMPLVVVGSSGSWGGSAEALQFLPTVYRRGTSADMPCAAWLLKKNNLIRETANCGMTLYPVVEGFAHAGHLPHGVEIKGSGADSPLLLTVLQGSREGRLQLLYADFYAAEHAVNELVLAAHTGGGGEPGRVKLVADDGAEYSALCAEAVMFAGLLKCGQRFRWSLSLLCNHYTQLRTGEVAAAEGGLVAVVQSAQRCSFCGLPLCHIVAQVGGQTVNVYAPVYDSESPLPTEGEQFCAGGTLYAVPDALVVPPVEETQPAAEPSIAEELLPMGVAVAVAAGGLLASGCKWRMPFKALFRSGVPEFRMTDPQGENLVVLVDTVVDGKADKMGYTCYAPDSYPNQAPAVAPETQASAALFLTVRLTTEAAGYAVAVEQHGYELPGVSFCSHVDYPAAAQLSEARAAQIFGEMMLTQNFSAMAELLREDVHYESETAGVQLGSRLDLLRHLRACFDNWQRLGALENIRFLLSGVEWQGQRRPCALACQGDEIISATIFDIVDNRVAAISSLAGDVLDTVHPLANEHL